MKFPSLNTKHINSQQCTQLHPNFFPINFTITITVIIFFRVPFSAGNTESSTNFTACSALYSCGSIKGIGYPFWGGDRPKFCGHPDFYLTCDSSNSNNQTYISIPSLSSITKVLNISEASHKMAVVLDDLVFSLSFCQTRNKNKTEQHMPAAFRFSPNTVTNLTLFYGCNNNTSLKYQPKSFTCFNKSDSKTGSVFYFTNMSSQVTENRWIKSCKTVFSSVPVLKKELGELNGGNTNTTFQDVLQKGVELEYVVNFSACTACLTSGGRCGSSVNPLSSDFVCYCPDRTQSHSLVCSKTEKPKLKLILAIGCTVAALLLFLAIALAWHRKKLNCSLNRSVSMGSSIDRTTSDVERGTMYFGVPLFSYSELKEATENFHQSKELGDGGFGAVYFGKLKDGREVAVKRLYEKSYRRVEQFMNEVEILTRLRHQNLVSLYGCSSQHCRELLLVYEYVPNGTVDDHLYGNKAKPISLPWHIRMNIAIETASALAYLHASDIIHRDIKTNNILLDNNFNVKVADFGLSRLFPNDVTHVSTAPQGTPGYLDPEYHQFYQLTNKSDVYSFGVVLIELLSSLPAVDMDRHRQEINLSHYAMTRIQRSAFSELVDPQLGFATDFKVRRMTTSVAELAFQCLQHDKDFRPTMDEVLESLKRIESANYDDLKAEEEAKNGGLTIKYSIPPPSPSEKDDAKLLSDHRLQPPSPDSVMDKWGSRLTTPSTSK